MNPDIHKLTKRSLRGYKYIAKDKNGQWFAYKGNDVEYRDSMWVTNDGYARIKCDHLPTDLLGIWPAHSKTTVENLLAMLASNPVGADQPAPKPFSSLRPAITELTEASLKDFKLVARDGNGDWYAYVGTDIKYEEGVWATGWGMARITCKVPGHLGLAEHSKMTVEDLLAKIDTNPVAVGFGTPISELLRPKPTAPCAPIVADPVNHPSHYTSHPSGVACITITEHMGFCVGNAIKYCWRADLKNDAIEDLKKARWYIDREIAKREKAKTK